MIIDADADLDFAVNRIRVGAFAYSGQVCISVQRVFVVEEVYEQFRDKLVDAVKAIQLGASDPWQLTDLIFYARHPELKGVPLTTEHQNLLDEWNSISALLVHPTLNEIKDIIGAEQLNGLIDDQKDFSQAFRNASRFKINAGSLEGPGNIILSLSIPTLMKVIPLISLWK